MEEKQIPSWLIQFTWNFFGGEGVKVKTSVVSWQKRKSSLPEGSQPGMLQWITH